MIERDMVDNKSGLDACVNTLNNMLSDIMAKDNQLALYTDGAYHLFGLHKFKGSGFPTNAFIYTHTHFVWYFFR